MSDNLHYNSQRDKDMDERLANPIEEKIVCKNCQAEYWESESHECKPIDKTGGSGGEKYVHNIDSGLDRMLAQSDKITAVMNDGNVSIDKLVKRIAVLEKALHRENMQWISDHYHSDMIGQDMIDKRYNEIIAKAEEQCKSK